MKKYIGKCARKFLGIIFFAGMVLGIWGGVSFSSEAATGTVIENGVIGTAFPVVPSGETVESFWQSYSFNEDEYYIETAAQLVNFASASKYHTFAGKTIHLAASIDYGTSSYKNTSFVGIGNTSYPFCGIFDGHGYTISGLYSRTTGLFYHIGSMDYPATIKNLVIDQANISGSEGRAVVVSRFSGNPKDVSQNNKIIDVTVSNSTARFSGNNCGIIAGRCQLDNQALTISGCIVSDCDLICTASTETNVTQWGMIIGKDKSQGYSSISDCTVKGSRIVSTNCNINRVGIAVGFVNGATNINGCSVSNSSIICGLNTSIVTEEIGAIVGCLQSSIGKINDCSVADVTITTKGLSKHVGLLAGHLYGGTIDGNVVQDSIVNLDYNASDLQMSCIGGLIGNVGGTATVSNCIVRDIVINNAACVNSIGGLVGNIESDAAGTIINDCSIEELTMHNTYSSNSLNCLYIGGVVGSSLGKIHVSAVNISSPEITIESLVQGLGGFSGYITGSEPSVISDCFVSDLTIRQTQKSLDEAYKCYHVAGFVGCVDSNSKFAGCSVVSANIKMQGRTYYIGGLIGSTYSDTINSSPVSASVTIKNCAVTNTSVSTINSRNCNEFGGLVGWMTEGSVVTNCYVSNVTNPANTNSCHVGGLIGYISESTSSLVDTTVKNCYVENCNLNGKNSISAMIGNAVATSEVFENNYHYNCVLSGGMESNASGAVNVTDASMLTNGSLVTSLNTTAGTKSNTGNWVQGLTSPVLNTSRTGCTETKVVSFNVYYLTQNESYPIENRQAKVIDLIDECCDAGVGVFGLQEVSGIWYSYINDYVKNTNTKLVWSGYGRYGGTFGGFGGGINDKNDQFSLILYDKTKYDKTDEGHFWLSDTPFVMSMYSDAYNYRVVNWVKLRDRVTKEEFIFVNAHLEETREGRDSAGIRVKQAQLICNQIEEIADGLPVVILGDWNSYQGTDGYSTFISDGYQDLRVSARVADDCGSYTAWTRTDPSKFSKGDHIVMSPLCTATSFEVLYEEDIDLLTGYHLSDHSPLMATIQY